MPHLSSVGTISPWMAAGPRGDLSARNGGFCMMRSSISGMKFGFFIAATLLVQPLMARDLHVDPGTGSDANDGIENPKKTIAAAIKLALPGDTIHLKPVVYHDYAGFYGKRGEPGRPITLDGHGATLEGSDPIDPATWTEVSSGLFKNDNLLPRLDD